MALALTGALLLGACQTGGGKSPLATSSGGGTARAISFESIDGPPRPVFDKLVASLGTEADSRNIRIVSREQDAGYRVRGYLAASIEDDKGQVDWVWDVFDKDRVRVLRVAGSQQVGRGKDVWARIDDEMANRIASESLTEIASLIGGAPPARPPATGTQPPQAPEPPAVSPDADAAVADSGTATGGEPATLALAPEQ